MSAHTPGPWHFVCNPVPITGLAGRHFVIASEEEVHKNSTVIALISLEERATEQDVSNARLIAAAPDLLSVLSFILRGMDGGHIKCAPYLDFDPDAAELEIKHPAERIRAAIAKATVGGQKTGDQCGCQQE